LVAHELKEYIFTNDKIEYILDDLGCHGISRSQKEIRCGLPNHRNKTAISIKLTESLKTSIYNADTNIVKGDIITLTMQIKEMTFVQALKYIHSILNIPYTPKAKVEEVKTQSPLDIFKKAKGKNKVKYDINDVAHYTDDVLIEFMPNLTLNWLREGITSKTARTFGIGFCNRSRRIVIPHRAYNDPSKIVGIMGRTTIENYELFDIPKYFPLKPYPKGLNLYGLAENYDGIQESGYVTVGESEKHVLKRHSRLDRTCVALCSHDMTPEQASILIGLDVEIVFALDKDIPESFVWSLCERFYGIRPVSYIIDKYDILAEKESPADKSDNIYMSMFKHRIKYDESKHKEYMKLKNGKAV
jgi:hypothetical protein